MNQCKNCETEFEGKFCPSCGQKSKTGRITIRQVFKEIRDQIVHFDRGFLFSIYQLAVRPGHTTREYLEGKRVNHVKPLKYLAWTAAINAVIMHYLGFQERLMQELKSRQEITVQSEQFGQKLMDFLNKYPSLMLVSVLPTLALASWLIFRKRKLFYAEYLTMHAYLLGQLSLLGIAVSVIANLTQHLDLFWYSVLGTAQWLIFAMYYGWAHGQFFDAPRKIIYWLKGVFVLILGYFLFILIIASIMPFIIYFFKPEIQAGWAK